MMPDQSVLEKRALIAEIDRQIAALCLQRIQLAEQVYHLKKIQQCPAVDLVQEAKVRSVYEQVLHQQTTAERIHSFVQSLIQLSKVYPFHSKELT